MAASLTDWLRNLRTRLPDSPDAAPDAELLTRFASARDEEAFAVLVARHGPMVFGVCRRVCGTGPDAEDAFQAAFVVLAVKAAAVAANGRVGAYLHGVALHVARKARERSLRRPAGPNDVLDQLPTRELPTDPDADHTRERIDEVLSGLPEKYRACVVLCDLEGLSRKDAAARLGWTEGTLSGRLARARTLLADRLTRRGVTLGAGGVAAVLSSLAAPAAVAGELAASTIRVVNLVADGTSVPAGLAALTDGVTRSMFPTRFQFAAGLLGVGLVAGLGSLLASTTTPAPLRDPATHRPQVTVSASDTIAETGWKEKYRFKHDNAVSAVAFGPDLVASGDAEGNLILWDTQTGKEREKLIDVVKFNIPNKDPIDWLAFNPDGTWLYIMNMNRSAIHACRHDPNNRLFPGFGGGGTRMLGFSPDGSVYFYAPLNDNKQVEFFNNEFPDNKISGQRVATLKHEDEVLRAAISADNKLVVTLTTKEIHVWDYAQQKELWSTGMPEGFEPVDLVISPDGALAVVTGKDGTALKFQTDGGKPTAVLKGHEGVVVAAFSQDSKQIATAGEDGTIRIRNAAMGNDEAVIEKAHTEKVTSLAFSPDGKMLVSGSADKTVKVWELKP